MLLVLANKALVTVCLQELCDLISGELGRLRLLFVIHTRTTYAVVLFFERVSFQSAL